MKAEKTVDDSNPLFSNKAQPIPFFSSPPPFPLQFKEIAFAYSVLSDESKRSLYDRGGEDAIKVRIVFPFEKR